MNVSTLWWQGGERHNQLLSIDEETVYLWDIDASGRSLQVCGFNLSFVGLRIIEELTKCTCVVTINIIFLLVKDYDNSVLSPHSLFQVSGKMSAGMLQNMVGGAWDPHDVQNIATVSESCLQFWDLRSMKY